MKTYYIASYYNEMSSGRCFLLPSGSGRATEGADTQFSSLEAIFKALLNRAYSVKRLTVEKVTETETGPTRRRLRDCEEPKPGETVQFAIYDGSSYMRDKFLSDDNWCYITGAGLYNSTRQAFEAFRERCTKSKYEYYFTAFARVAITPGGTKVTREVVGA